MFTAYAFWAMMGYCGSVYPNIPIPGGPPPPPDPFRIARFAIVVIGGIVGGYLGQTFLEPSFAVSGMSAFAVARVLDSLSWVLLNPQPLPPKEQGR